MKRTKGSGREEGRTLVQAGIGFRRVPVPGLLLVVLLLCLPAGAAAMQVLDAMDHAELEAEISDRAVSRIALAGDRIARVIRGPDGFAVEHDAARGDLYLRPTARSGAAGGGPREPLTLFIGTAAGFTYRLALIVAERGSAQVLVRNAAVASQPTSPKPRDGRVNALVALISAVARRDTLPGYSIETLPGTFHGEGLAAVEVWRGPRFTVRVLEATARSGRERDAGDMAGSLVPRAAAVWLGPPGTGPSGGRLVVAVNDAFPVRPAAEAP